MIEDLGEAIIKDNGLVRPVDELKKELEE